ncbi:MAG: zinc-binding dehydrogenase, partial [SAR202 cluster bacterium]|nr:zinc-binding dehydrogenase [SAR202 cluster bacterium]
MKTKAAVQFTLDGPLELVDLEIPDPSENQVIVKMYSSGVCHSQLHQMANPNLPRPLVLGHEGTGIVTKTGKNVSHVSEGDHVIVTWVKRIETQGSIPAELTGASYHETPVNGNVYTLGEDVLTNSDYVVPISKEYPTDISCIVGCAVLTGAGAVINTAQVKPGESVAVFGVGGVGLCAIQAASISKANPVIAVDLDSEKLKFAQEFGATHLINASENDPIEQIKDITNGGVDYAFDAIGVKITNEQILESTRSGGSGANNLGGTSVLI